MLAIALIERAIAATQLPPAALLFALIVVLALVFILLLWLGGSGRAHEEAMLGSSPDLPVAALRGYGLALVDAGRLVEAEAALRAHLAQMPSDMRARAVLAALYAEGGAWPEAADEYGRALHTARQVWEADPAHLTPFIACLHAAHAVALRALGGIEEARAALARATELDATLAGPDDARAAHRLVDLARDDELERRAFEDLLEWEDGRAPPTPFGLAGGNEAVAFYRAAVAAKPNNGRLRADLAQALHAVGDHRAAEREFEQARRLDARDPWIRFHFGLMRWRKEQLAQAEELLVEAARLGPRHAGIRGTLGVFVARLGRYDEAERELGAALEARPTIWVLASLYGIAAFRLGHFEQAARAFVQADRLGATDTRFRLAFADLWERQGRLAAADEQYRIALRHDASDSALQAAYGAFLMRQDRLSEAERVLWGATLLPDSEAAHFALARLLLLERRLDEVVPHLDVALRAEPGAGLVKECQVEWLSLTGRVAEAEELGRQLDRGGYTSPTLYLVRGEALLALGRELEAQAALREAVRLAPDLPERLLGQARALVAVGRTAGALDAVGRALALRPEWPEALAEQEHALQEEAAMRARSRRRTLGPAREGQEAP